MRNKKRILILIKSYLLVLSYDLIFAFILGIISFAASFLGYDYELTMDKYYLIWDSLGCFILLIIYYYILKKHVVIPRIKGDYSLLKTFIITLGSCGLSFIWLYALSIIALDMEVIGEFYEDFGETWSNLLSGDYIWIFLSVVILGPLVEEVLFRGILINVLNTGFSRKTSIIIAAFLFGIWHKDPVQMVYTTIFGIFLGMVYSRTNDLRYPLGMHILNNSINSLPEGSFSEMAFNIIMMICLLFVIPSIALTFRRKKGELSLEDYDKYWDNINNVN